MLQYAGDSFKYINTTGEIVAVLLGAIIWLGYVLVKGRSLSGDSLQHILWFTFWMGQFNKSVRSPRLVLLGNGIIGLVGLIVLVQSVRKTTLRLDLLVPYLMASVLLYTGATLLWYHDGRNVKVFFIGLILWCAVLWYFRCHGLMAFLDHVFTGFGWLIAYIAVQVLVFELLFPGQRAAGIGIAGPFRANSLTRNLFVLLVGLFFRYFVIRDVRRISFYFLCVISMLLNFLTLSRSGMALMYLFLLGNLRALGRSERYAVILLSCVALPVVWLSEDFTVRFKHRSFETGDGGRLEGIKVVIDEGKRELLWGHGFMKSSVEDFLSSSNIYRERGYSSHCYFASVFYEFGLLGSCVYAALSTVVFYRLYRMSRFCVSYKFALVSYVCFVLSGFFENSSWWPITPFGFLATVMIVTASGVVRQFEADPYPVVNSPPYRFDSTPQVETAVGI